MKTRHATREFISMIFYELYLVGVEEEPSVAGYRTYINCWEEHQEIFGANDSGAHKQLAAVQLESFLWFFHDEPGSRISLTQQAGIEPVPSSGSDCHLACGLAA